MSQPTFKDAQGREWFPRLDFTRLREIRDQTGADLGLPEQMGREWAKLIIDDAKTIRALWIASAPAGIGLEDFQAGLDGEAIDNGVNALQEAVINFTRPLKRGMVRQAIEALMEGYRAAIAEGEKQIQQLMQQGATRAMESVRGMPPQTVPESLDISTRIGL